MAESPDAIRARLATLSDKQRGCLMLVRQAMKTEQIAGQLGISPSAVNRHIELARGKLGAANRAEAALMLERYGTRDVAATSQNLHLASAAPPLQSPGDDAAEGGKTDTASGRIVEFVAWRRAVWPILAAIALLATFGIAVMVTNWFHTAVTAPSTVTQQRR